MYTNKMTGRGIEQKCDRSKEISDNESISDKST